jgi:hypothetical protein
MKKCTNFEIFKVQMGYLGLKAKEIIVSVIKKFLCNAIVGITEQSFSTGIWENNQTVHAHDS